jgi:hypothetical protein
VSEEAPGADLARLHMELSELWVKSVSLARFACRVRGFVGQTITPEHAEQVIAQGVQHRQERFLEKLQLAVYPIPNSPYRQLLNAAGCEFGDVQSLVEKEGLEGALRELVDAGVYLSYEEFKCRKPTVRGGRTFHFREDDFDDPRMTPDLRAISGGSRGRPTKVANSVPLIAQMVPHWAVFFAENRCLDAPLVFWEWSTIGMASTQLACAKFGQRYAHWFVSETMKSPLSRLYSSCVHALSRLAAGFPRPEKAHFSQPGPVLERLLVLLGAGKKPCVYTTPSAAVRLSLTAQSRGNSLSGVTFLVTSEPLTPARLRSIVASGARAVTLYGATEATWIGGQCRRPRYSDEVHVLLDRYAVIPAREDNPEGGDAEGQSLLLTSLDRISRKVLLNTDIGDRAVLETRRCDCLYDRLGCHLCLHTIRSSDKLTALGANFAVSDVFRVLEETFPRRFGGAAGDYQLVETVNPEGLKRYTILVSPALSRIDYGCLPDAFLSELSKLRSFYGFMASAWARESMIDVRRAAPIATSRGKVLPFHRLRADLPSRADGLGPKSS